MSHTNKEILKRKLEEAATQVEVGGTYVHYKNDAHHYVVRALVLIEATEEIGVVYESVAEGPLGGISWLRPLTNFLETVQTEGGEVRRFSKI